jgi:hypothetical protein
VRYPPFQDFPQYVALARTLAHYASPALGFQRYFTLNFETNVLFAPWLAAAFAWVFDALVAAKLVLSLAIVATPWGVRLLLRSTGRPVEYAGFALPLAYNAHVMMGFVSYVVGVALMLWALAFGALVLAEPRRRWQIALGVTSVCCLYSHVVPWAFSIAGIGLAALVSLPPRRWASVALPLAPALLLGLRGFLDSATGWSTLPVGLTRTIPNCPLYDDTLIVFSQLPGWISDVFRSQWDERLLLGLFVLGWLVVIFGGNLAPADDAEGVRLHRTHLCFAVLAPLGIGLYFVMPRTCDWIWPIHARFLFVGVMLATLVLPRLGRNLRRGLAVMFVVISLSVTIRTVAEFRQFQRELGDLEPALAAIPLGQKVAALTVDKAASPTTVAGFHHFGAYCQAERGGLTMFSFATMHHWPIQLRPELKIPELSWNFQFNPAAISSNELSWADYVLTRGPTPRALEGNYIPVYQGNPWRVFARRPQP